MSQGARRAGEELGGTGAAMEVKGVELPAYDPRGVVGMGLAYATSSRGGCHLRVFTPAAELAGLGGGRFSIEGKAEFVVAGQNVRTFYDSTGLCYTCTVPIDAAFAAELYGAVTGENVSGEDLSLIGERTYNVERLIAMREGIGRAQDRLPTRFFDEELVKGPAAGHRLDRGEFDRMLDLYYQLRGWSKETGAPTAGKLAELGLEKEGRQALEEGGWTVGEG